MRPSTSSAPIATTIDNAVRSQPSRIPNDRLAPSRMDVIRMGGRKRLSIASDRPPCLGTCSAVDKAFASPAIGFLHVMPLVDLRVLERFPLPRRPPNDDTIDRAGIAQTVVEPALVLSAESRSRRDLLGLHMPIPVHLDASADRAAIAGRTFELELDPVTPCRHVVLVDQQR